MKLQQMISGAIICMAGLLVLSSAYANEKRVKIEVMLVEIRKVKNKIKQTPVPTSIELLGAVWFLGSDLIGLAGSRIRFRR